MDQGLIQILGLRPYTDKKTGKELKSDNPFFARNWRAPSVAALFSNLDHYVSQIPEHERWNMYYTALNCGPGKREWLYQDVIPFDIDGIQVERLSEYHPIILQSLQVKWEETGVVFSGNGLQYIIGIKERITDEKYFEETKRHYKAICAKLNHALALAGLPGAADPSVHSPARLLRLPETFNRKPGRPERKALLLQSVIHPADFSVVKLSGLPDVAESDQISSKVFKKFHRPDTEAVLKGCAFLEHVKTEPTKVNEPEWYAALAVLGHLENGNKLAHEYSEGHKGYSHAETEEKLEQALKASGPRTCKNIDSLWGKCSTCPNYNLVASPISIRGPDYIRTADTGFHDVVYDLKTGALKGKPKPNYEDLRKHFEKENPYRVLGASRVTYSWDSKVYREIEDAYLENYAQRNFNPTADTHMVNEFKNLVQRTNLETVDWWDDTTKRKVNFQNGVYDLATGKLLPHNPNRGFRYILEYNYEPEATCPNWDKFLQDVTCGDRTLAQVLLEFMGYALSSDTYWEHKCLILDGHGRNGKSTFIDVLKALAGKENYSTLTMKDLNAEGNRQMLDGKLFNIAGETPTKSLYDSTMFKALSSGEEVQVRQLYKKPYQMINRAKLIFACNQLPESTDTSEGFFERFLIVPFRAKFTDALGNRDPFIKDKLFRELPGIFNQTIRAYSRMLENRKFSLSKTVENEIESFREMIDTVLAWYRENVELHDPLDPEAPFTPNGALYQSYRNDTEAKNLEAVNAVSFGRKLSRIIPDYVSRSTVKKQDKKTTRGLLGVGRSSGEKF